VTIGADCCGIDRIGFEQSTWSNTGNEKPNNVNVKNGSCHWTALAEAEGYKWIPPVSTSFFLQLHTPFV